MTNNVIRVTRKEFEEIKNGFRKEIEAHTRGIWNRLKKYEVIE